MKPNLDCHGIMNVHNAGNDASFAHVTQNKVAFSGCGCILTNLCVL